MIMTQKCKLCDVNDGEYMFEHTVHFSHEIVIFLASMGVNVIGPDHICHECLIGTHNIYCKTLNLA